MHFVAGIIVGLVAALFIYIVILKIQDMLGANRRKAMFVSPQSVKRVTAVQLEDEGLYEPFVSIDPVIRTNSRSL